MDKLLKGLIFDGELTLSVLETTEMVNEAIRIHNLSPVAAAAFGRTLTASTFMASNMKNNADKLSVVIAGDGVGGKITVSGNGNLDMRGCVDNPTADLPLKPNGKLDVSGFVGKHGRMTVVRSMGLKEPYSGTSELISGEIAEDFAAYYAYSEQIPTAVALGVKIGKDGNCLGAGGVIVQALPYAQEKNLIAAEKIVATLSDISTKIETVHAEGVLKLFTDEEFLDYYPKYKCLCSRENTANIVASLGKKEVESILQEQGSVKVGCEYCGKEYVFTADDVKEIFGKK